MVNLPINLGNYTNNIRKNRNPSHLSELRMGFNLLKKEIEEEEEEMRLV